MRNIYVLKYSGNLLLVSFLLLIFTGHLRAQQWTISNSTIIPSSSMPHAGYWPDGVISVLDNGDGNFHAYWAEFENFRTVSSSPYLADHINQLNSSSTPVFGGREPDYGTSNGFDDGGKWFIGTHKLSDGRLVGFFHAESHWYPRSTNGGMAYKSIGVAYSSDNGLTWTAGNKILNSSTAKPTTPTWSGLGDGCVVWNHKNNKWYCFYTPASNNSICLAVSSDPAGSPGTWSKYYNGSFSQNGLTGYETPISNLSNIQGANPSIQWNIYLNKFVMVWHGWSPQSIYISFSDDLENWTTPVTLINEGQQTWYPNLVGSNGTNHGGQQVKVYYGTNYINGKRDIAERTITFSGGGVVNQDVLTINASGGDVLGSGGIVAYSVGQAVYTTNDDISYGTVAQGIQHTYEIFVLSIEETELNTSISVYPNPTTDILILKTSNYNDKKLSYQLFDMQGRLLREEKIKEQEIQINSTSLSIGVYFINVMDQNKKIQSFKIIKNKAE